MKRQTLIAHFIAAVFVFANASLAHAEKAALDVLKLKSPPEGRYAAELMIAGEKVKAEFLVSGGNATCVKSEKAPGERKLVGASGRFQLLANGVFIIGIRGDGYTATQFWAWQPDGSALIKEVPDRGENQRAVPITEG